VLATRYQDHIGKALAGRHLPVDITHTILGSFGGALAVASGVGGASGALLAHAARAAFMSGLEVSFLVGAGVSLAGVVTVLVWLPSRASPAPPGPPSEGVVVLDRPALTGDGDQSVATLEHGHVEGEAVPALGGPHRAGGPAVGALRPPAR
jgi:hypothetical protein